MSVFLMLPLSAAAAMRDVPLMEPDVQPKQATKAAINTGNVELGLFAGVIHIEDFSSSFLWGGRLAYHLSESFFLESAIGFARGGMTSFEQLSGDVRLLSDADRDYTFYNLNLGYKMLPGEAFFGNNYAFNSYFYLIGGAGATEFAGDMRFTGNLGVGYQILLTDGLAVHLNVREHMYRIDVLGEGKTALNTEVSSGISYFF